MNSRPSPMNRSNHDRPYSNHDRPHNDLKLHDVFLNHCRRERVPVAIHFVDQSVKHGMIIGFDPQSIIIRTNGRQRLIFKSSICMIDPQEDFAHIFHEPTRPGAPVLDVEITE